MADNVSLPPSSVKAATRDVTYSGESAHAQVVGLVGFSGSDDAKTATDIPGDAGYGLDVDVTRLPGLDSFGHLVVGTVNNQIDIQFYRDTPANLTTVTTASGGTATATGGMATFAATTTANSSAKGVTTQTTNYTAGAEVYTIFTAAFTGTGSGTSYHRIGLYDDNNGVFIGYEGGTFKATLRKGGSDTASTAKASWNVDTLTGAAGSKFTRAGTPEAIDLTKLNVWRIRFGWVGSAPVKFEVLSPDGEWVLFHVIRQPNNAAVPSLEDADLPFTCHVNSGNSAAALSILTNCWCAGTTQALSRLNATLPLDAYASLTRAVIAGESTAGGGAFVNVKVNPSGSLSVVADTELPAAAALADNTANPTTSLVGACLQVYDGATWDRAPGNSTDGLLVNLGANNDVTVTSGTVSISGSVAVTGTFWQATQPVSLASLPSLAAGSNNIGDVDVLTVPAPLNVTGNGTAASALRVTLASDSTGTVAATQSGTWNVGTVTTVTSVTSITNALPAGTNAIGKLAANSGVDIGDVDVTSVTPGTAATNLGKAEDAAHTTGDVGVMALGVVDFTGAGAAGDYAPLNLNSEGKARVESAPDMTPIVVASGGLTTASTAYVAGDQVGTLFTLANAARVSGKGGYITSIVLIDKANIIGAYDVVFFNASVTLAADNAAFSINDTDSLTVVKIAQLSGSYALGNGRMAQYEGPPIPYTCVGGTSLYAALICRYGHTFFGATTDLQLTVYVDRQ